MPWYSAVLCAVRVILEKMFVCLVLRTLHIEGLQGTQYDMFALLFFLVHLFLTYDRRQPIFLAD